MKQLFAVFPSHIYRHNLAMRAYANHCADTAQLRKRKAMRQIQSSAAFILVIILLGIAASPQSVPSSQGSASDLAGC